jgi:hypothetical protein
MSDSGIGELSREQLDAGLVEVLEHWPLYRMFKYRGKAGHQKRQSISGPETFGLLPERISLYCHECANGQQWQTGEPIVWFARGNFYERLYRCRNCGKCQMHYFLYWAETAEGGIFLKVGQYPALPHHAPKELERRLDEDDRELYTKALDCRNFNYGLGAVSYLRRIVENRVNDLLDRAGEVAREEGIAGGSLEAIEAAKTSRVFAEKLDLVDTLIPVRLKPSGFSPISGLHDLVSDAIHRQSEDECIDVFDKAKLAFEYVFTELEHEKLSRETFIKSLKDVEEKRKQVKSAVSRNSSPASDR